MIDKLPRWLFPALFFASLAFSLFMALDPAPPSIAALDRYGDKFEHMLAFATMAALARLACPRMAPWRLIEHMSFLGALIEVFQAMPQIHRDCDWRDWAADTVAATLAILIVRLIMPILPKFTRAGSKAG